MGKAQKREKRENLRAQAVRRMLVVAGPVLGKLVPCYAISSKMLFVPVNAAQFVPPTGIFETVGGGFPVFFPVPTETGFGSRARPRAQGRRDIPSQLMESRW
jgi:hypothetical protein